MQFNYKAETGQIIWLQHLSSKASQKITYHCRNSVVYEGTRKGMLKRAARLMAWNDVELTAARGGKNQRLSYDVLEDGCKVSVGAFSTSSL